MKNKLDYLFEREKKQSHKQSQRLRKDRKGRHNQESFMVISKDREDLSDWLDGIQEYKGAYN